MRTVTETPRWCALTSERSEDVSDDIVGRLRPECRECEKPILGLGYRDCGACEDTTGGEG